MNRLEFFESINGIEYPNMIVEFFDHFIGLKKIVEDSGQVDVLEKSGNTITFMITFTDSRAIQTALSNVSTGQVIVYNRPINVHIENMADNRLKFILQ